MKATLEGIASSASFAAGLLMETVSFGTADANVEPRLRPSVSSPQSLPPSKLGTPLVLVEDETASAQLKPVLEGAA